MKLNRRFKVTIQVSIDEALVIEPPITIRFDINRHLNAALNGITLQLFNLSEKNRNLIYQDRFDQTRFKMIVEMGYDKLSTVFVGDIFEANTTRSGTDLVTTIIARDGNYDVNQTVVSTTIKANSTLKDVLEYLAGQFPNLKTGIISKQKKFTEELLTRPCTLEGNVYALIKKYARTGNTNAFIDLEFVNILGINEVLVNNLITVINAETGMINTPRRDQSFLTVTTLLEPRVKIAQALSLESTVLPQYNGLYKVVGLQHQGIISEAVNGECRSTFNLNGNQIIGGFDVVT